MHPNKSCMYSNSLAKGPQESTSTSQIHPPNWYKLLQSLMRAAGRLTQPHTTSNAYQQLHRLGALPQPVVHVRNATQLNTGTPAVTQVQPPSHAQPAAVTAGAAAAGSVHHPQAHTKHHRSLAAAEADVIHVAASAAERRKLRQQVPVVGALLGPPVDYHAHLNHHSSTRSSNSDSTPAGLAALSCNRHRQLNALQSFLGYTFRDLTLLDQACTHDSSGSRPSYCELAFVGDAALWLLFAEHAFRTYGHTEDPISGGWPAHLSRLLSRANCAATARQWGLDAYLQHSTPQHDIPSKAELLRNGLLHEQQQQQQQQSILLLQDLEGSWERQTQRDLQGSSAALQLASEDLSLDSSSSSTSTSLSRTSSSSSSSGMYAGAWTSDTLAEMFEGLVGALLLDSGCDHDTLKQLLLPWVASSMDASKQAAAAAAAAVGSSPLVGNVTPPAARIDRTALWSAAVTARAVDSSLQVSVSGLQQLQDLQRALQEQLLQHCGVGFDSQELLAAASQHMMQVLQSGVSCAEAETQKFLGFAVLQFAAALQAYYNVQDGQGQKREACHRLAGCVPLLKDSLGDGSRADFGSSSSSSSSPGNAGRKAQSVHQMSKHAAGLTTVRHRAKMWLLLLDGTPWCPEPSYLTSSSWKKQKQALARCLDLLLAAVYLDSGLEAAVGLATVLIQTTPPTSHDKSWMPAWARHK